MEATHLPQSAIEEDHRLEASTERAGERLAKHRWHWTLDESNPERVAIRIYAQAIGRSRTTVTMQANGYAAWMADRDRPLNQHIQSVGVSVEQGVAIEAVAQARGISAATVRQRGGSDVRFVRDVARHTAEAKGTSVTDEIPEAARRLVATEESEAQQRVADKERHPLRWVEATQHVGNASRELRAALKAIQEVPFDQEERDLLHLDVVQVIEIARLIDTHVVGSMTLDWDAELAKIMEGAK